MDAGYVEAVATEPSMQGSGYGTQVMREMNALLQREYELGALSSGEHGFYERLGWVRWQGPTYVRSSGVDVRTPEEDSGVMVLRYGSAVRLDLTLPICCDDRPGDAW